MPAMDTLRSDDVGARLAPHDAPNMGALATALQLEVLALRHQLQVLQRTLPRRLGLTKSDRFVWMGSPTSEPDPNEASGFPIAANRWTGNGTNSARLVEKLCSGGNRRVEKRSLAKRWKQT